MNMLGIAGSLRRGSLNRRLLENAQRLAPPGVTIEIYDRLREIPLYDADLDEATDGGPEPVQDLKSRIQEADGLLVVTPEYNYSIPGVLKNAIDWASRPPRRSVLVKKPIGIAGVSEGNWGTVRAQLALRQVFLYTNSVVLQQPEVLVAHGPERFAADGRLRDAATEEFLTAFVRALADLVARQKWIDAGALRE